jgi:AraC-like DNA-binding protein
MKMDFVQVQKSQDLFAARQRQEHPVLEEYNMHVHDFCELYMLLEGKVEFCVETAVYPIQPGDLLIARPGEAHFAKVDPSCPYERMYFQFPTKLLKETLNEKLLTPFLDRPFGRYNHYTASDVPIHILRGCMEQVFETQDNSNKMRTLAYILPALQAIFDSWKRKDHSLQPEVQITLPTKIVAYINQYLFDIKNPAELAKVFYISESQLNRTFRSFTGSSVWEYVRLKRLFTAREMILSGKLPHLAASQCGFGEYSTFFRGYKKQFGHSPQIDYNANARTTSKF